MNEQQNNSNDLKCSCWVDILLKVYSRAFYNTKLQVVIEYLLYNDDDKTK